MANQFNNTSTENNLGFMNTDEVPIESVLYKVYVNSFIVYL